MDIGLTLGGASKRRRLNAPRGRLQPINLDVAQGTNVLTNPRWHVRGMHECIALSGGMWRGHM